MGGMQKQAKAISFTFVNQTGSSAAKKIDEEELSVIRSHAMRTVHHKRRVSSQKITRTQILRPVLSTDWENVALCQFFDNFVFLQQRTKINAFQYLDFLPAIYKQDAKDSHLTDVVLAVALAHLANQKSADDIHAHARRVYARSLSRVIQSLANPAEMASDEVLATLCLLTKYEIITGKEGLSWRSHEKGQAAIINHRGKEQLQTEAGASLFRLVWIRQQLNCIANSELPPEQPAFDWDEAFPSPCFKQLMQLIARVAMIRYESQEVSLKPDNIAEEVRIWRKAMVINEDMQSFRESLPSELQHRTIPSHQILPVGSPVRKEVNYFPENIHLFENLQRASIWTTYCYSQIYLLQTLLKHAFSLNLPHQQAVQQAQEEPSLPVLTPSHMNLTIQSLRFRLRLTVDDVCASVPFLLGWSDDPRFLSSGRRGRGVACHYSIWALAAILSVREIKIPQAQREWVRARLGDIGLVHGIRHALVLA